MEECSFEGTANRRSILKAGVGLGLGIATQGIFAQGERGKIFAYVGSYTTAVDGGGNGKGIYRFEVNAQSGEFMAGKLVSESLNPSWIVIHPSRNYLYAINEIVDANGTVSAFAIDHSTADLTLLNVRSSEGKGPAHMSLDRSGRYAFVANYWGGTIAVLPILSGGKLGPASDVHTDAGSLGSKHAADAPPGSYAISGHDAPHAHMIVADPANRFVLSTDLGQDRIYVYGFDSNAGKLVLSEDSPFISLPSGDGPRHLVFHPNGRWIYALCEESSTIVFYRYDAERGGLTRAQTLSSLPPHFAGTSYTSEIVISPDGRFLYTANRLDDTIAISSIGSDGELTLLREVSTMGDYPRHCTFDPSGRFFYVCNQRSDSITSFAADRQTGMLTFTGRYTPVGSPTIVAFLG